MTDDEFLTWLQHSIDYVFQEYCLLQNTLISPGFEGSKVGSEEERRKYEGNRTAAHLGDSIIALVVRHQVLLVDGASRDEANNTLRTITGSQNQEERAEFIGIKAHLKLNQRQKGKADPTTLRLALCAIIGAVWLDCNQNFMVTMKVVQRLLIGPKLSPYIDPKTLSCGDGTGNYPEFDEWLHNYGTPGESAFHNNLNILGADFSHSQDNLGILPNNGSLNTVPDVSRAKNIENINQSHQLTVTRSRIHETLDPYPRQDVDLRPASTSIPLFSNCDGEVDSATPSGPAIALKRRQPSINKAASQASTLNHLNDYMRLEKERCHSLGLSFSSNDFDTAMITACPNLTGDDNKFIQLKTFYFSIGSAQSLASLKSIVAIGQRSIAGKQSTEIGALSLLQRMEIVERLNSKIAYNIFRRRYHIYHLIIDSRTAHEKTSDGFVNSTFQSISTNSEPQIGNPHNLSDSQLSKDMLKKLHPYLTPGTPDYTKKLTSIKNLRRLGERFQILVEKFGYGIIGLLPLPGDDLAADSVFNASDSFILSITDVIFKSIVKCLVQLRGEALRDTSRAISPVVRAVFEKNSGRSEMFAIDQAGKS